MKIFRLNCQHPSDQQKSRRVPEKTSTSALLTMPKPSTVWITTSCGKFFKRWEYQTTWPASWEICIQVKMQQLEVNMEQQPGSKWGKEYVKVAYCHPAYLIHMQSTSWEMLDWMKHKLDSCKCEFLLNGYLWLLIFLPAILIPACTSSSPAFCIMYSAYKLNKQSDSIQP